MFLLSRIGSKANCLIFETQTCTIHYKVCHYVYVLTDEEVLKEDSNIILVSSSRTKYNGIRILNHLGNIYIFMGFRLPCTRKRIKRTHFSWQNIILHHKLIQQLSRTEHKIKSKSIFALLEVFKMLFQVLIICIDCINYFLFL